MNVVLTYPVRSRCLCRNQDTAALTVIEVLGHYRRCKEDGTERVYRILASDLLSLDPRGEQLTGKR
jgi:hypothetical protein